MNIFSTSNYFTRVNVNSDGGTLNLIFFRSDEFGPHINFDECTSRKLEAIFEDSLDLYRVYFDLVLSNENIRKDKSIDANFMTVDAEINRSQGRVDLYFEMECSAQLWKSLSPHTTTLQKNMFHFHCGDIIATEFNNNSFRGTTEIISVEIYNPTD